MSKLTNDSAMQSGSPDRAIRSAQPADCTGVNSRVIGVDDEQSDLSGGITAEKQAMGDARSTDLDEVMPIIESSARALNIGDNHQSTPNGGKHCIEEFKARLNNNLTSRSDDDRRRQSGMLYASGGRRGPNGSIWSRTTSYTPNAHWRSSRSYGNGGQASLTPDQSPNQSNDSLGNNNNTSNPYRSHFNTSTPHQTRIFHNGALRGGARGKRGYQRESNLGPRTVTTSAYSSPELGTNSESVPNVTTTLTTGKPECHLQSVIGTNSSSRVSGNFPIIYVAPTGTICIILEKRIFIEIAVDRAVRVVCHDKFSVVCNGRGSASCILHTKARIFQQDEKVFCNFGLQPATNEKSAVFGTQGVLFTMSHLNEAYLVSSTTIKGTLSVALGRLQFPSLDYDYTVRMFFTESQTGNQYTALCNEIVQEARYGTREDGSLTININGVFIKQDECGDVEVNCRPRHISCSPSKSTVHVRTNMVDMAVQDDDKAFVKRGLKRVHVSRSGMVVSDGNCITSMDHYGHIVSSN